MDIKRIVAEINELTPEEKQAKLDALRTIINARLSGGQAGSEVTSNDIDKLKQPRNKKNDQDNNKQNSNDSQKNAKQDQSNDQSKSQQQSSGQQQPSKQPSRKDDKVDPTKDVPEVADDEINKKVIEARRTQREASSAANDAQKQGKNDIAKQLQDIANSLANKSNEDIDKMSDQEVEDLADKVADLAADITGARKTDKASKQDQIKKVQDLDNDELANQDLEDQEIQLAADAKALQAQKDEIAKYNSKPQLGSLTALRNEMFRTVKNQIQLVLRRQYSKNVLSKRQLAGLDIIEPGITSDYVKVKDLPSVDVYYDQSLSWEASDIAAGNNALGVLNDFVRKKLCKVNIYYFATRLSKTNNRDEIGWDTSAWYDILDNIKATKAKNVLIMTDGDMNGMAGRKSVTVQGAVWWLWKNARYRGTALMADLHGSSNKQFVIQGNSD